MRVRPEIIEMGRGMLEAAIQSEVEEFNKRVAAALGDQSGMRVCGITAECIDVSTAGQGKRYQMGRVAVTFAADLET